MKESRWRFLRIKGNVRDILNMLKAQIETSWRSKEQVFDVPGSVTRMQSVPKEYLTHIRGYTNGLH